LDTELKLLKSQYHPHFLFNALNTIYFQIEDSNMQAKHSIELLSELLRYQLYDIKQKVTVKQELDYLEAYIQFQRLRMSERLVLTEEYDEHLHTQEIHPLLFQPLVENTFKYVSGAYWIHFSLKAIENKLVFTAWNSVDQPAIAHRKKSSGLGIENMKKRLQILYPGRHLLKICPEENTFFAELTIELTPYENKMCDNRR
jgi:Putative regulator of cell autolysis